MNFFSKKINIFDTNEVVKNLLTVLNMLLVLWIICIFFWFVFAAGIDFNYASYSGDGMTQGLSKEIGEALVAAYLGSIYAVLAVINWIVFIIALIKHKRINLFQRITFYLSIIFIPIFFLMENYFISK